MTTAKGSLFAEATPRYYSIDAGRPFLLDLANGIRDALAADFHNTPEAIAEVLIYLPTRRAGRALADAFAKTTLDATATLLPKIRALGDVDEDEIIAFAGRPEDEIALPPAISAVDRRLALARLVAAREKAFAGHKRWAGALSAADELGKLLDSLYTEEISPDALENVAPDALAEHWAQSLEFLKIITEHWPAYLQSAGMMDPAERRIRLIDHQTALWSQKPPQHSVIIAGSTGSTPAVARMMRAAAQLPMGCVVLPGLDRRCADTEWKAIDEPHPQSGLKSLLTNGFKISRNAVAQWPASANNADNRSEIIDVVLRPANASDSWRDWAMAARKDNHRLHTSLQGLSLAEAEDEEREAEFVALKIRETLDSPARTVFLVTPDRDLGRRVSLKLRRWNINVDDSAGIPFSNSPCGTYLRLAAQWLAEPSDAAALIALLRHPLTGAGLNAKRLGQAVDAIDLALRGVRTLGGVEGLFKKIAASRHADDAAPALESLIKHFGESSLNSDQFEVFFRAHIQFAERLAATDDLSGSKRLWRGADGETGAATLAGLHKAAETIASASKAEYPSIFEQLIAGAVVRRHNVSHPRVAILGPLEARLQSADVIILSGLNEGVWPRDAAIDPFLSRPMRKTLGLPSPERRIGLAAHDFAQLAAAPTVMLTRAAKAGGAPTKTSRWLVRLKKLLDGAGMLQSVDRSYYFETLARRLEDAGPVAAISAPAPRPPLYARPQSLSVTRVEKLIRDPYAIYARYILRIRKLDALSEAFAQRHLGTLLHRTFELFVRESQSKEHSGALEERLQAIFEAHAEDFGLDATRQPFWRARLVDAFAWFAEWHQARATEVEKLVLESAGGITIALSPEHEFTLQAKADRIDLMTDKTAFVFDYKTGAPPVSKAEEAAFSPQLPLTALIVREGGFTELGARPIAGFAYLKILNRTQGAKGDRFILPPESSASIETARAGLLKLLSHFNDPSTAYLSQPRPKFVDAYGDYDHLARRRERQAAGGGE
ncbi:MAG: double-strand break repair protein AddB [Pseudomonadota bacterium]